MWSDGVKRRGKMRSIRKNKNILYQIPERERGHLEAFAAQRASLDASYLGILKGIIEREKLPPDSTFDPEKCAFIKSTT